MFICIVHRTFISSSFFYNIDQISKVLIFRKILQLENKIWIIKSSVYLEFMVPTKSFLRILLTDMYKYFSYHITTIYSISCRKGSTKSSHQEAFWSGTKMVFMWKVYINRRALNLESLIFLNSNLLNFLMANIKLIYEQDFYLILRTDDFKLELYHFLLLTTKKKNLYSTKSKLMQNRRCFDFN